MKIGRHAIEPAGLRWHYRQPSPYTKPLLSAIYKCHGQTQLPSISHRLSGQLRSSFQRLSTLSSAFLSAAMDNVLDLDPNGDTVLVLSDANNAFPTCSINLWPNKFAQLYPEQKEEECLRAWAESTPTCNRTCMVRVSSKHLTLASAFFRETPTRNWTRWQIGDQQPYRISAQG